jgi:hypothetical protein
MDTDLHGYVGGRRFEVGVFASRLCPQSSNAYFISVYLRASAANCRIWVNDFYVFSVPCGKFALYMRSLAAIVIFALSLISLPAPALSGQAVIKNTLVTSNKKELLIHFRVDGGFTPKIEEAIQSGIPTTFIYRVALYKRSGEFFDTKMVLRDISHTIKYDTLRKDYTVTMSEKKDPMVTQDYKAAKDIMARVEAMPLISLDRLQKDTQYSLQIKAELDTIKLPPILDYLFFFVSYWDFETAWETVEFTY